MASAKEGPGYGLAIETSGDRGEVALGHGDAVLDRLALREVRAHARDLVATVAELAERNHVTPGQLEALYVSIGPGSFTGLRIGVTTTRMLAYAIARSTQREPVVVGVPTMLAIAENAVAVENPPEQVVVLVDAMRGRGFASRFERRAFRSADASGARGLDDRRWEYVAVEEPSEVEVAAYLASLDRRGGVMGAGVHRYRAECVDSGHRILPDETFLPRVDVVYGLGRRMSDRGETESPHRLTPLYVRIPDAEEKWRSRQAVSP